MRALRVRSLAAPNGRPRPMAAIVCCVVGLLLAVVGLAGPEPAGAQSDEARRVLLTRIDDPITPIIADHLDDALAEAEDGGYEALVVEIDTPGGLSTSMRDIVQDFLAADVPVVAHVTPRGARAASAGALIGWSAHLLAMAPSTTIGAATPVQLEGGEVGDKVVEDAAAFARAVAEARGHDVDVVAAAVTEGRALSTSEAIDAGVADLTAADTSELLRAIAGRTVSLPGGQQTTLETAGAAVDDYDLSLLRSILQFLADPNLAFILLSLGTLGIIYELASPGIGAGGGLGAVFLILGLVALSVLPVDAAGLLLLLLAAGLFVAEVFAPGIGIAAVLGAVALVLSAIFTFRDEAPGLSLSLAAVVPTALVVAAAVVLAGRLALRARGAKPVTGVSGLVGEEAVVANTSGTRGQARIHGSWWTIRSDEPLQEGATVRVTGAEGLELEVEPVEQKEEQT